MDLDQETLDLLGYPDLYSRSIESILFDLPKESDRTREYKRDLKKASPASYALAKSNHNEYIKGRYSSDPEFRKKHLSYGAEFRKKNPNYMRDYARKRREARKNGNVPEAKPREG